MPFVADRSEREMVIDTLRSSALEKVSRLQAIVMFIGFPILMRGEGGSGDDWNGNKGLICLQVKRCCSSVTSDWTWFWTLEHALKNWNTKEIARRNRTKTAGETRTWVIDSIEDVRDDRGWMRGGQKGYSSVNFNIGAWLIWRWSLLPDILFGNVYEKLTVVGTNH